MNTIPFIDPSASAWIFNPTSVAQSRDDVAKAVVSQRITLISTTVDEDGKDIHILRVHATVTNISNVLLEIGEAELSIDQVLPPVNWLSKFMSGDDSYIGKDTTTIDFPVLLYGRKEIADAIEPSESHTFDFDFVMRELPDVIQVSVALSDAARKDEYWWWSTELYKFPKSGSKVQVRTFDNKN